MENSVSDVMAYLPGNGTTYTSESSLSKFCLHSYNQVVEDFNQSGFTSKEEMFKNYTKMCCINEKVRPAYLGNLSADELMTNLAYIMPLQHYEYSFVAPFAVIIFSLIIVGFFGNLFTVIVIMRNRVLQSTSHYLLSLALSDMLLLALTGPLEVIVELRFWPWSYSSFLCHTRYYLIEFCLFTSVLHITAFTIERYVAICHPMKAKKYVSTSRAIKLIVIFWMTSFLISIPLFLANGLQELCPGVPESTVCQVTEAWSGHVTPFHIFSATILFLLPMTLIIVLYSLIARVLFGVNMKVPMRRSSSTHHAIRRKGRRKENRNGGLSVKEDKEDQVIKTRKQVVKMLVVIAACFFTCWCPFHLIRILPMFGFEHWPESVQKVYFQGLYHLSIILMYVSSTINPILYNVMSARFRRAFKQTILCRKRQVARPMFLRQTLQTRSTVINREGSSVQRSSTK